MDETVAGLDEIMARWFPIMARWFPSVFVKHPVTEYVDRVLYNRKGNQRGTITNTSRCPLEGCTGARLHVRWQDGKRTYPCSKGVRERPDGAFQIM
jgi:hypothetical protein